MSELLRVSATGPTKWWNGDALPGADNIVKIVRGLDIDAHWLLMGEGEMERRPAGDADRLLAEIRRLLAEPVREPRKAQVIEADPRPRKNRESDRKRA